VNHGIFKHEVMIVDDSYDDLRRDVQIGHEIEFVYKSRRFSITQAQTGWVLSEFQGSFQTFTTYNELLEHGRIDGHCLADIWGSVVVETIF
jgi:hypothetical protein